MLPITRQNKGFFFKRLISGMVLVFLFYATASAQASGPAFKKLAEANNAYYRGVRELGPAAKPSEILAVQNRTLGPAMAALQQEHNSTYQRWRDAIKKAFSGTKEELSRLLGLGSGGSKPGSGAGAPAAPIGRASAQQDTGAQGGESGATGASFGGKRKEDHPAVDDAGIILDR